MRICPALFFLIVSTVLSAQEQQPEVGFLRFVNAIGLRGNLHIKAEAVPLREEGFPPGGKTGGIGFLKGSHSYAFKHESCEEVVMPLPVDPNTTRTIVVVFEEKKDKENKVTARRIKTNVLPAREDDGKSSVTVYSFSRREVLSLKAFINSKAPGVDITLKFGESSSFDLPPAASFNLGIGQRRLMGLSLQEPGHYAVVLYDDPSTPDGIGSTHFLNHALKPAG
jgi:hypothetical protein